MAELDRLSETRNEAKRIYDAAERSLASARYTLNFHERALNAEWHKLAKDDVAILPAKTEGGLEIKTSYERVLETERQSPP